MKEDTKLLIFIRCLGTLGGLLGGCIIGGILTVLIIMITNSTLGLKTIWPGVLSGGLIGGALGLLFPKIGRHFLEFSITFHEYRILTNHQRNGERVDRFPGEEFLQAAV
jgi:hypothetical protein